MWRDAQLRSRVEALLSSHENAGSFLQEPAAPVSPTIDQPPFERPGTQIGPYRLLEKLGEGGMGVVFLAEQQEPVERQVALKIIRPGMDSRHVIARFEAERQALALMDHPHVARVLDAGTAPSGRPYFVMELVEGIAIHKYCDQHELSIRERLELFIPVCQAVQHAHQKGIIHRDIKPSNILVSEIDGRAVPKVIDFGVAKAIDQGTVQKELVHAVGPDRGDAGVHESRAGPAEPARCGHAERRLFAGRGALRTARPGSRPLTSSGFMVRRSIEALHIIESEEPPQPSRRLSDSDSLPSAAALRHVEPQRLTGLIRGELDWIVMKALEKDRARRYESAASLARDIENYLHDQPVAGGPAVGRVSAAQVRAAAQAGVGHGGAGGAGPDRGHGGERVSSGPGHAGGDTWRPHGWRRWQQERAMRPAGGGHGTAIGAAGRERDQYLVDAFRSPDPERDGRTITVVEVLDRTVADLRNKLNDQPLVKARLLDALGESYAGLGLYREARQLRQECLEIRQRLSGPMHPDTLESTRNLGRAYQDAGLMVEAIQLLEDMLRQQREKLGPGHPSTLVTTENLADAWREIDLGKTTELHEEALQLKREHLGPEHPGTLSSMHNLARAYLTAHRTAEAIELLEETLRLRREQLGVEHPDTLESMTFLAFSLLSFGRMAEGIDLLQEALRLQTEHEGAHHPNTLASMRALAAAYSVDDRKAEAIELYEKVLACDARNWVRSIPIRWRR